MRTDVRLTEQNFGKYESTARDGAEFRKAKEQFVDRFGSGESMLHLAQRIYNLLDELKADPEGRSFLLVAHNGIARVVESYFRPMTNEEYASFGIKNCAVLSVALRERAGSHAVYGGKTYGYQNQAGSDR